MKIKHHVFNYDKVIFLACGDIHEDLLILNACEVEAVGIDYDPKFKDKTCYVNKDFVFDDIDLDAELISKPGSREEALTILNKLNGKKHYLVSSVCISKNGSMIWNFTDKAELTMKNFTDNELNLYLSKISDEALYAYNVYQIEGEGRNLFSNIQGDENTIMGLPIKQIKEYLNLA